MQHLLEVLRTVPLSLSYSCRVPLRYLSADHLDEYGWEDEGPGEHHQHQEHHRHHHYPEEHHLHHLQPTDYSMEQKQEEFKNFVNQSPQLKRHQKQLFHYPKHMPTSSCAEQVSFRPQSAHTSVHPMNDMHSMRPLHPVHHVSSPNLMHSEMVELGNPRNHFISFIIKM